MDFGRFLQRTQTRATRTASYAEMVPDYYTIATPLYRESWSDSFHLPPFQGQESVAEATQRLEHRLAEEGGFRPGWKVLDVGCGIGRPARTIAACSGAQVTGITIAAPQVDIARELTAQQGLSEAVRFVHGDAMDMPFDDEEFDAAYNLQAMCHAPDKAAVHREIARVLKPGGVFLGNDWLCRDGITSEDYAQYIEPMCRTYALPNLITLGELEHHLEQAGLRVTAIGELEGTSRNWDIFAARAQALANRPTLTAGEEYVRQSCEALARAGRARWFVIGYWHSVKAPPAQATHGAPSADGPPRGSTP
ncbi:SAM-dependent methyltransferase [Streptomyces fumanus]|uniref:SAM-dependent methyltransferase Erg6/SMT-type domain-containing protein n=1 Tax=Streptomyces fumanus TaxID=67302 RepID=A0A919AD48_9ACTN|nr:class I SAM-dependent methyltransferase [Streptomyces fumanus]GHE98537.1 hypothetical protein GCM10018772_23710 [Streptomyces fumanus]